MEVWSKGLGSKALNIELGEGEVENRHSALVLKGAIGTPVFWDYTITMEKEDIIGVMDVITQPGFIRFLMGSKNRWKVLFSIIRSVLKSLPGYVKRLLSKPNRADGGQDKCCQEIQECS